MLPFVKTTISDRESSTVFVSQTLIESKISGKMEPDDDQEARTIFCANLVPEKITEELLYELFIQVRYQIFKTSIMHCNKQTKN